MPPVERPPAPAVARAWAATVVGVEDGPFAVVGLAADAFADAARLAGESRSPVASVLRDGGGTTLVIDRATWSVRSADFPGARVSGPMAALTPTVPAAMGDVGYLAAGVAALAGSGVPVVVQCAYDDAVILVPWPMRKAALAALEGLIARAQASAG